MPVGLPGSLEGLGRMEGLRPERDMPSPWDILMTLFELSAGPGAHWRCNPGTLEPQPFLMRSCHQNQVDLGVPLSRGHHRAW